MAPSPIFEPNAIYRGDNLELLASFPPASVDLAYLDPPFFSNRRYEVIWGDEAEIRSFEDRWSGGIQVYVAWMRERVLELHRILKPTGSLYLHCDPTASHYLKVMLDEVFGVRGYRSEIIWKRSSAHNDTRQGRRQHGRVHDVILYYTKGSTWTWNPVYTPYEDAYVSSFYKHVEPDTGRRYGLGDLTGPGGTSKGSPEYEVMGVRRAWRFSRERMADLVREGRVVQAAPGRVPRYKRYLDEMPGIALQDLWLDIPPVAAQGPERQGFPTQKPVALLQRIVESSSRPGDLVLDAFCGCGTSLAAAHLAKRQWVGVDISPTAVNLMQRRLRALGAEPKVHGMPVTDDDLRELKPFEFQNLVIDRMNGTHSARKSGDMGIDGYSWFEHLPIQVKQVDRVGRNAVDNFETAVERSGRQAGYIVAFDFTRDAREEAARARTRGLDIRLVRTRELFADNPPADLRLPEAPATLPAPRAVPTAKELVKSERSRVAALMDEIDSRIDEARAAEHGRAQAG